MFVQLSVQHYTCYPPSVNLEKGGLYQIDTVFRCDIISQIKRELYLARILTQTSTWKAVLHLYDA